LHGILSRVQVSQKNPVLAEIQLYLGQFYKHDMIFHCCWKKNRVFASFFYPGFTLLYETTVILSLFMGGVCDSVNRGKPSTNGPRINEWSPRRFVRHQPFHPSGALEPGMTFIRVFVSVFVDGPWGNRPRMGRE
jgi:hypothetical protein